MSATTLARISGTMLTPGVSRNNRLYTHAAIGRAVQRMRERLADPGGLPIVMRTHHAAGDDTRLIVGRITDVTQQPDGSAAYEARLFDTAAGRDIGALIDPKAPAVKSTSIHGYWIGPVEQHRQDGVGMVETGSDLEIDAIDFTATPGVPGAQLSTVAFESAVPRAEGRPGIEESGEATVVVDPAHAEQVADQRNPIHERYTAAQRKAMAGKGQALADGSYPIANKSDLRNAIRAVGRGGAGHDAIRKHIMARADALGFAAMIPDSWNSDGSLKEAAPAAPAVAEAAYVEVCVYDDAGPLVKVCAANVDPDLIQQAAKKAAKLAARVLDNAPTDPDDDYTLRVDTDDEPATYVVGDETHTQEGTVAETWTVTVNGKELSEADAKAVVAAARATRTSAPAAESAPATGADQKGVAVSSDTAVAEQATSTTPADLARIVTEAVVAGLKADRQARKADRKAKEAPTDSGTTSTAESTTKAGKDTTLQESTTGLTEAAVAKMLADERAKTIAEVRETLLKEGGLPGRKGFRHVNESDTGDGLTGDDLWNKRSETWAQFFPQSHSPAPAVAATTAG